MYYKTYRKFRMIFDPHCGSLRVYMQYLFFHYIFIEIDKDSSVTDLDLDVISLLFPSLQYEFNSKSGDEYYIHIELDSYFKLLTKPYEITKNENLTNFSRTKKSLSQKTHLIKKRIESSSLNPVLTELVIDKLVQRSEELINIINLTNAFPHTPIQSQSFSNSRMNRKSHGNSANNNSNFDQLYLLAFEEFILDLNVVSSCLESLSSLNSNKILLLKNQAKNLLQLICTYLKNSVNTTFEQFNAKLNVSICNYLLSELYLHAHLRFGLNEVTWRLFSDIVVDTNFFEIFWEIYTYQPQAYQSNESMLYENSTQLIDDYELNQENLNT